MILKPRIFWPFTVGTGSDEIRYTAGGVDYTATIAHATYLTPESLAAAIQTALTPHMAGVSVLFNDQGHHTLQIQWSGVFALRFNVSPGTQPYAMLGFLAAHYDSVPFSGNEIIVAPYQHQNGWYCPTAVRFDSAPIRDRSNDTVTRAMAGNTKFLTEGEVGERKLKFSWLPPEKIFASYATGSYLNEDLETFWANGRSRFRYWEDGSTLLAPVDYVLSTDSARVWAPVRQFDRKALYEVEFKFWKFV